LWTASKNRAKRGFFFLHSVTVNTIVHTESETCQKQWSRLFCFRFSLSISFSTLAISTMRRAFHLLCCLTSFWKVGLRWRNPKPCMAFRVSPLILSLGCSGAVSVSAAFSKEILCNRVFCVLFLCSFLSPARLRAFHALSCSHLTSFIRVFCSLWIRSASAWPVGFSTESP